MGCPDPGAVIRKLLSVRQLVRPLAGRVMRSVAGAALQFLTIGFVHACAKKSGEAECTLAKRQGQR
jgi:hypothetical protein